MYTLTTTKEAIIQELQETFKVERDCTEYYGNLANVFLAGSGKQGCDATWLYKWMYHVTVISFASKAILPPSSKGEKWDTPYIQERIAHLDQHLDEIGEEGISFIATWPDFFTTIVWVITLDEDFTDEFERVTAIPYKDGEEPALV